MKRQPLKLKLLVAGLALATSAALFAQDAPDGLAGVVSGSGTAVIKRQPDRLRLQIDLLAKGKTLPEALSKLKDRREAARSQIVKLGVAEDSIEFGDPKISRASDEQQQMLEMMVRQRMGARKKATKDKATLPVTVSISLKAEWPLKAKNVEELLVATHELEEKIKSADLAGTKETEKPTAEEEELSEEMEGIADRSGYGNQQQKPGTPVFAFVAKITEKDRAAATAEAFQKAKTQAARLADAAGAGLGPLRHLNSNQQFPTDDENYGSAYSRYAYQMMRQQMAGDPSQTDQNEAIGPQAGTVSLQVTVTASFGLKAQAEH